jgi:hypothetical protein
LTQGRRTAQHLSSGNFEFVDNYQCRRFGSQRLFPIATMIEGKRAPARA